MELVFNSSIVGFYLEDFCCISFLRGQIGSELGRPGSRGFFVRISPVRTSLATCLVTVIARESTSATYRRIEGTSLIGVMIGKSSSNKFSFKLVSFQKKLVDINCALGNRHSHTIDMR
jgi:hypothetical protein